MKMTKGKKKGGARTETVEEDEEVLIGAVVAWRITERRRDGRQLRWWLDPGTGGIRSRSQMELGVHIHLLFLERALRDRLSLVPIRLETFVGECRNISDFEKLKLEKFPKRLVSFGRAGVGNAHVTG
jgi:hypothetical protein